MQNTSARYKELVYSRDYARHFVPEIVLKIIDTKAREFAGYAASSTAFYNDFSQLMDENFEGTFDYGTLEDFFFLLDGTKRFMPEAALRAGQYGFSSEQMSDENGNFNPALVLTCSYTAPVITVGRVYYFDTHCDAVPKDFDMEYYRHGVLLKKLEIRGNTSYIYTSTVGVRNYDQLVLRILSTTHPYRRVHIVEDIPGVYLTYGEKEVVSLTLNQAVDLFGKELISGEVDFQIENTAKTLDILNADGFEKYLQRRQPVDINLRMVFPDNTHETIPLGLMLLTDWKSQKGALTAQFTARDATDTLSLDEYVEGSFKTTPVSLYELAKAVLDDAGIAKYKIDIQLMNIYTTAPLPIGSHKELLRLIAQAGQSVVLPTLEGGIHIKWNSPLVSALNQLINPCFDNDWTNWSTHTNCVFNAAYIYSGKQSAQLNTGAVLQQSVTAVNGHKFYIRFYACPIVEMTGSGAYLYVGGTAQTVDLVSANLQTEQFTLLSCIYTCVNNSSLAIQFKNNASMLLLDGFMCIDLTVTYGAGKEPDAEWCDANIRFFNNVLPIPRAKDPAPVDTFDYSILLDAPEIATTTPTKSVETNIYTYRAATNTTEVYKGSRYISGTDEFIIKFNSLAKNCTVTVQSLDSSGNPTSTNTATLVSSSVFAQAARLKVIASGEVQIIVTGLQVSTETSQFKIDSSLDVNLVPDAKAETIDNRLITNRTVAEDVTGYAIYWYNRRYAYNFDWRQNPAVEILDTAVVYDDFSRNNGVLLTERTLDYADGVLGGSSKGVY